MFAEKTLELLLNYVNNCHEGNVLSASKALDVPNDTLSRWIKGEREPGLFRIGKIIDEIILNTGITPQNISTITITYTPTSKSNETHKEEIDHLRSDIQQKDGEIKSLNKTLKMLAEMLQNSTPVDKKNQALDQK